MYKEIKRVSVTTIEFIQDQPLFLMYNTEGIFLGLLTTLVVATYRCRKMSSDTTAFDISKCRATFSKMSIKMSMSKMSKYFSVQNSNI